MFENNPKGNYKNKLSLKMHTINKFFNILHNTSENVNKNKSRKIIRMVLESPMNPKKNNIIIIVKLQNTKDKAMILKICRVKLNK